MGKTLNLGDAVNGSTESKTEFSLLRVENTWRRCKMGTCSNHSKDNLSAAKIFESVTERGSSWTVVSPIVFTYQVVETQGLLDPSNDTLLLGHIRDPRQLEELRNNPKPLRRFVVMDQVVYNLYGAKLRDYFEARHVVHSILPLPTTEENKSMELVMKILDEVHKFSLDRRTEPIIAIGGGVCLDIVGLAASLYRRRTPYIRVPTTLLSYVDASVGAKTGVNFASCKNKLGSYVPPVATFLDRSFFQTISRRQISNGLAEMLKMALMKHSELFELLETHGPFLLDTKFQSEGRGKDGGKHGKAAVTSSRMAIKSMLEELAPNLWEDDLNRLVDFGHLISPELEMEVLPTLLHGEAVNIDMSYMVYVSRERGLLTEEDKLRIIHCMEGLELPVWHPDLTMEMVKKSFQNRLKHSGGLPRIPLPIGLGHANIFNDTTDEVLCKAFKKWCDELGTSSKTQI